MTASGYLLFHKPSGTTSFKALGAVKRSFPGAKVGHTGTLDSFASGLLVVLVGAYSRLAPWFVGLDKRYRAEIHFGVETDTLDPGGRILKEGPLPEMDMLEKVLPRFTGQIAQVPPKYSALHIDGQRASDLAVRGLDFEIPERTIEIYSLVLESYSREKAVLEVHCSSGTYVRSLARDIAAALGTVAHVSSLQRLSVGAFRLSEAAGDENLAQGLKLLDPASAASMGLSPMTLGPGQAKDFRLGRPNALKALKPTETTSSPAGTPGAPSSDFRDMAVFGEDGRLLGIAREEILPGGFPGKRSFAAVLSHPDPEEGRAG